MSATYDLVVIGAGSAGLSAATFAAELGARVALVDRARPGGDCLATGCVPSKTLIKVAKLAWEMGHADRYGLPAMTPMIDLARVNAHVQATIDGTTVSLSNTSGNTWSGAVTSLAFSPDGSLLLSRTEDCRIFTIRADGSGLRTLARGNDYCSDSFSPDGTKVLYIDHCSTGGVKSRLFTMNLDGTGVTRITTDSTFDGFPMFSPDGRQLGFASNRYGSIQGETNIFIADWVEHPQEH